MFGSRPILIAGCAIAAISVGLLDSSVAHSGLLLLIVALSMAETAVTSAADILTARHANGRDVTSCFGILAGESAEAAAFSDVPVERTVLLAHVLAGLISAVAALVQTGSIAVGSVRVGLDLPILAVAATILGGVVFGRGEGGVWGPFFGVLSFALLFVVMTVFGIDETGKLIAQGLIILMAAILYGARAKRG